MLTLKPYSCPVCDAPETLYSECTDEGKLYESENRCDSCALYYCEFSYGYRTECIGFVTLHASWDEPPEAYVTRGQERAPALAEIRAAYARPEFKGLRERAPCGVLAEWLNENGFGIQGAALMEDNTDRLHTVLAPHYPVS